MEAYKNCLLFKCALEAINRILLAAKRWINCDKAILIKLFLSKAKHEVADFISTAAMLKA